MPSNARCAGSRRANASVRFSAPAMAICHPVAAKASMPSCQRLESADPSAHANDATGRVRAASSTRRSSGFDDISRNLGHSSTTIPPIPNSRPAIPRRETWSPRNIHVSINRNHSGVMETISAASPVGTTSSARARMGLATVSNSAPMMPSRTPSPSVTRMRRPLMRAPEQHQQAGDKKTRAGHQQRRNVLHRDADAEVGRAPEHVHQRKRKGDAKAVLAVMGHHGVKTYDSRSVHGSRRKAQGSR